LGGEEDEEISLWIFVLLTAPGFPLMDQMVVKRSH
jgi:hypothetical protein